MKNTLQSANVSLRSELDISTKVYVFFTSYTKIRSLKNSFLLVGFNPYYKTKNSERNRNLLRYHDYIQSLFSYSVQKTYF